MLAPKPFDASSSASSQLNDNDLEVGPNRTTTRDSNQKPRNNDTGGEVSEDRIKQAIKVAFKKIPSLLYVLLFKSIKIRNLADLYKCKNSKIIYESTGLTTDEWDLLISHMPQSQIDRLNRRIDALLSSPLMEV